MSAHLAAALAVAVLMLATWGVSLARRDASIVDIVWGLGFVLVAWTALAAEGEPGARQWLLVALTTAWGLRLAGYLAWRNLGKGEDYRYQRMRRHWGDRFPLVSLVVVFGLQGVLMWVVSLPLQAGAGLDPDDAVGVAGWVGVALWALGLVFETVGDAQLAAFKADPANQGRVMDRGLWAWTRHPNYFGDACVWWGLFLLAADGGAWWTVAGPVVMTVLLVRVSGKDLLERSLRKRRPGYDDYIARTSGFLPLPPRRRAAEGSGTRVGG